MEQTTALEAEEEPAMLSSKVSEPHETLNHAGPSRGRDEKQVTAVGIRGQRHPPDPLPSDICCFLGTGLWCCGETDEAYPTL